VYLLSLNIYLLFSLSRSFINTWYNEKQNFKYSQRNINQMEKKINKIQTTKQFLKEQYLADSRPWVVTFSGGKDSSTVLHLTVEVLLELKDEGKDSKTVYIVSSDTGVEMPVINNYFFKKLRSIKNFY